jgi:single-strand DNA-binding protein
VIALIDLCSAGISYLQRTSSVNHSRGDLTVKVGPLAFLQCSSIGGREMPKSVNKVILVGNVGKDPEVRYSQSGIPVANFSLATNEKFKDRNGEWQDRAEWHSVVAWKRLAEIVGEYVAKGSMVYVEGKIQTSTWEDRQSGERKYRTEIVARDLLLLGPRENGGGGHQAPIHNENEDQGSHAGSGEIVDDDIPF